MTEARNYASLSSGLLARKGTAKPAMRPQSFGGFEDLGWNDMGYGQGEAPAFDAPEHVPSSIAALTPAPRTGRPEAVDFRDEVEEVGPALAEADDIAQEYEAEEADDAAQGYDDAAQGYEAEQADVEDFVTTPVAEIVPSVAAQQRAILERFDGEEEAEAEAPALPSRPRRTGKAQVVSLPKRKAAMPTGRKSAFTLRLDGDRHLRLRLACAVSGRSAQQIVMGALDEALAAIPEIEALAARVPATGAKRN